MDEIALEMSNVYKKFKKGEIYNSLRDLIPAIVLKSAGKRNDKILVEREFWALHDINFNVKKGEAFGIIGPNGAGKSTILKLLCGIIHPTTGTINVQGRMSALIEVGAGFHQDLTGRENIFLNGTILGMTKEEIRSKLNQIIEFSGLEEFIDTPVKRYSSGMYARLGFSVAAHVEPDILVVDEVLSVGDFSFQNKCIEKMRTIIKNCKTTVIFVSHNLKTIIDLCDRAILLNNGIIVKEGPAKKTVGYYINNEMRHAKSKAKNEKSEVFISKTSLYRDGQCSVIFESGERTYFEVEIVARNKCKNLIVYMGVFDKNFYNIFATSTEMISNDKISMEKGESKKCIFELFLHLAPGEYFIGTSVSKGIGKSFDSNYNAARIFIKSDSKVSGFVNMYPKVIIK